MPASSFGRSVGGEPCCRRLEQNPGKKMSDSTGKDRRSQCTNAVVATHSGFCAFESSNTLMIASGLGRVNRCCLKNQVISMAF
jgi:hypothetical protein